MKDWKFKDWKYIRFLIIVLYIQFAFWLLQIFDFPIFGVAKYIITSIYLLFIPGVIILRILKIQLDNIEKILYSVGISISTLMFIGFFMNMTYPLMGINKPISIKYLIITLGLFISILLIIMYEVEKKRKERREYEIKKEYEIKIEKIFYISTSKIILILLLLIFSLSILGTYVANYYQVNILLMIMLFLIVMTSIFIMIKKPTQNIYYISIFIMSLSLLYQRSLISSYLTGWDIHSEFYLSNLVLTNSLWNIHIISNVNAMLSIVMLAPIFSILYNIDLIWVYKTIYPILFSLVPIGLFKVFQKQTNDKIAFLSCFFFISILTYYAEMISLARQEIAELFLVLMMLVMISENLSRTNKVMLYIIFGFSFAVSHYGMSYLFLFSIIFIYLIFPKKSKNDVIFTSKFVLLFSIFTLTWYVYVAEGSAIIAATRLGNHLKDSISELLNPQTVEGMNVILRNELSPMRQITKYLFIVTQIFIGLGIFSTISSILDIKKKFQFKKNYLNFSYINMLILILGIAVPYVASTLNSTRLFQIATIFLAPFSVIGGFIVINYTTRIGIENSLIILSILFFSLFLLFNSGFIYEIAKEPSSSIALNYTADYPRFNEAEVLTAYWIKENIIEKRKENIIEKNITVENDPKVYSDEYRDLLLSGMIGEKNYLIGEGEEIITKPLPNSFIFLGKENIQNERMTVLTRNYKTHSIDLKNSIYYKKFSNMNIIYDSGFSQIMNVRNIIT